MTLLEGDDAVATTSSVKWQLSCFVFVLCVFAVYIGLDLLAPCSFTDAGPAIFLMILLVGQLTLICVWGTLVEGTFWFRLPWTLLLLVISWAALCGGIYLDSGYLRPAQVVGMGLIWFYGFFISYVPLKIAAWIFGWRIIFVRNQVNRGAEGQYAIRDIMVGTAILGLVLAIGRQFVPGKLPEWSDVLRESGFDRPDLLTAFLIFSVISLIVKLPCIWIALAAEKRKILGQSVTWIFCAGALGFVELLLLFLVLGDPGRETVEVLLALVCGHSIMAASMIAVLYGLRCFGYQMIRKQSKENPAAR